MNKITAIAAAILVMSISRPGLTNSFYLQFSINLDNGLSNVSPDTFFTVGSTNAQVSKSYDINDLLAPPSPPGKYLRMYSADTGVNLIKDYRPFDPNLPDMYFPIRLLAHDTNSTGLSGTIQLKLLNPSALGSVPSDTLVYLRRSNASGVFTQYYNLRDPNNHSIEWQISDANGLFAHLELYIRDKCLAADLNDSGMVEFVDFAKLAIYWLSVVPSPSKDISGDSFVNMDDAAILAEKWLCACHPD